MLVLGDPGAEGRAAAKKYDDKIAGVLLGSASNH